jgi:crotonobetainyl-CoA:carnitine CoA-transferase CaiB-like acyl-CoA transferase
MSPVCEGLRIIDFGQDLSPTLATMILADNGAEVLKIEPPGGEALRSAPAWPMWNRGKQSVVLDLETPEGRTAALQLARGADVVIESFGLKRARELGLDYAQMSALNPGLVYASITAFGDTGTYAQLPAIDAVVEAKTGTLVALQQWMERSAPTYRVRPNPSFATANLAIQGIIAALHVRSRTGLGQRVETSLFDGVLCYEASSALARQCARGIITDVVVQELGGVSEQRLIIGYMAARCKDGQWLQMTDNARRLFANWMRALDLEWIFEDPRYAEAPNVFPSLEDKRSLRRILLEKMQAKTLDEWLETFAAGDVAAERYLTTQQMMDHPQTLANSAVIDLDDPTLGPTRQIGPLIEFGATPSRIRTPAPLLGQHTRQVLDGVSGRAPAKPEPPATAMGVAPKHPFEGLLLLDFAGWLAAPFGMSLMADLGARVIKIESPIGDEFRPGNQGRGRTFQGKESLVLDLKAPVAKPLLRRLLERADGLMHNMRGDTPKRLGIDYESVKALNPRLVYLYAASYGSGGPGAGRGAFHPTAGALNGGTIWQMGHGNAPPAPDIPLDAEEVDFWSAQLLRANEGSPDVSAAVVVGTAMAMGLYARERTGEGQYIETRMLTSNAYVCSDDFVRYAGKPPRQEADRDLRGLHALHRLYETAEGWVFLACPTQVEWEALCRALGRAELLADPRFATAAARRVHDDHLIAGLAGELARQMAEAWEAQLLEAGVTCVRADRYDISDFFLSDPFVAENGFSQKVSRPGVQPFFRAGPSWRLSRTPARAEGPSLFGADTPAILSELGLSEAEISDLRYNGVVAWE